jgi:hypothetical protein
MQKTKLRRGGYVAPYSSSPNSAEYMLNSTVDNNAITNINYANNQASGPDIYVPPSTTAPVNSSIPGIRGGAYTRKADKMKLNDTFYYSLDGGCACNAGISGGYYANDAKKTGGDVLLTPFVSALALLGARMLADKNSGFNFSELMSDSPKSSVKGGRPVSSRRRRGGAECQRDCGSF